MTREIPHMGCLPRKPIPGTVTFSAQDHHPLPLPSTSRESQVPLASPETPVVVSEFTFRPPITPASLSHHSWSATSVNSDSHHEHDGAQMPSVDSLTLYDDPTLDSTPTFTPNPSRRRRTVDDYSKIDNLLPSLRDDRISPIDILNQVLNPMDASYDRYRIGLYREDSDKLSNLIENIMADDKGKAKLLECMRPHLEEFACDIVAQEMETRRKNSFLQGVAVVTPTFMENLSLDEEEDQIPFLSSILEAASQTDRAKIQNKKKNPTKLCQVITRQLLYQYSNRCLAFQTAFGLFLWSTGCARQTIDALFRCALSVGYYSVQSHIEASADFCMDAAANIVQEPHSFEYDNLNVSRSIFYEQVGERGVGKVTSGTFGLFCLRNAKREHMLLAPMMKRFRALAGLQYNRDIRPSLDHLASYLDQVTILVISRLAAYEEEFEWISKHPDLQHIPRRPIPVGYKTKYYPLRASTIEEATVLGNLQYHDEIYIHLLKQDPESLSKYAIPSYNDQLTNARIRSAQSMRAQDINPWERREVFQLGFGLFHACLNLMWAILHTHRGSVNDAGSLAYFFALMEKTRLGNDQPDYHTLLAALMQVLDGIILNTWLRECGFVTLKSFAASIPTPETLRRIAHRIINKYAASTTSNDVDIPGDSDESSDSGSDSEPTPAATQSRPTLNPKDDIAHHNLQLLTRDLLMVAILVRAISDGDFGRVEVLLPHLAMMYRGAGCNKYCTELLHFLQNLKYVWTPEFADIMRDNMIICLNGRGPGHCMAIDLNIEHLIGYLKNLLRVEGLDSTWDRLGNTSAAIARTYQSTGHTTPNTSHLVWRVQAKIAEEKLQVFEAGRARNAQKKPAVDILSTGEAKLKSSTLATFNKKTAALVAGLSFEEDEDECPAMALRGDLPEEYS
ncbi:hypothetical protein R3P38DRAFT_3326620 [Favolaschia claudopus]|uniref:DUF6589 domain-containing protein n=1 Tax=Favolaschia claudopus TaxID=2862362 RepID=A0AAW0A8X0_9AGAR